MLLTALLATTPLWARPATAVRYVDCQNGNDANDGLTWETAKATLVAGLEDGIPADVVPEVNLRGRCVVPEPEFPGNTETCKAEPILPSQGAILRGPAELRVGCTTVHTNLAVLGADIHSRYVLEQLDLEALNLRRATVQIKGAQLLGISAVDVDLSLSGVRMSGRGEVEDGLIFSSSGPGRLSISDSTLDGGETHLPLGFFLADGIVGFPPVAIGRTTFGARGANFSAGEDARLTVHLDENVFTDAVESVNLSAAAGAEILVVFRDNVFLYSEPPAVWLYGEGRVRMAGDLREPPSP
jgi:hypothetical protein